MEKNPTNNLKENRNNCRPLSKVLLNDSEQPLAMDFTKEPAKWLCKDKHKTNKHEMEGKPKTNLFNEITVNYNC